MSLSPVQSHVMKLTQRRNVKALNLTTAELKPATIRAEDISMT